MAATKYDLSLWDALPSACKTEAIQNALNTDRLRRSNFLPDITLDMLVELGVRKIDAADFLNEIKSRQPAGTEPMDVDHWKSQPLLLAEAQARIEEAKLEQMRLQREMRDKELTLMTVAVSDVMDNLDTEFEVLEQASGKSHSLRSSRTDGDIMCGIFRAMNLKPRLVVDFSSRGGPQYDWLPGRSESQQSVEYTDFICEQIEKGSIKCIPACHDFEVGKDPQQIEDEEILSRRKNERQISYYLSRKRRMYAKPDAQFFVKRSGVAWNLFGEVKLPSTMVSPSGSGKEREIHVLRHATSTRAQLGLVISSYNSFTSRNGVNLKELEGDGTFFLIGGDDMRPLGFLSDLQAEHEAYILIFEQGENHMWLSMIEMSQAMLFWILRRLCGVDRGDEGGETWSMLWERVVARSSPFQRLVGVWDQQTLLDALRRWIGENLVRNKR